MNQLLNTNPEDFIPFFAIFFTFMIPILAIYFYHQQKKRVMEERKLMIEKGMTPPPMKESIENFKSNNPTQKGMKMIAIALGLLVGYFISQYFHIKAPFSILGSILFFLGIANVINASMSDKIDRSPLNNDNEK